MSSTSQNGWNEYSRLVLKELETLADGIDGLRVELQNVKQELTLMRAKEDKVEHLSQWKTRFDDICSPSQLENLIREVEDLRIFKTRAVTIFAAAQIAMGIFAWALNFLV